MSISASSPSLLLRSLAFSLAASFGLVASAEADEAGALAVTVNKVAVAEGSVLIAVFDTEAAWTSGDMHVFAAVPAKAGSVTTRFEGLMPGAYAIRLFHDVNANGELDANLLGIPTEPYGFSNDAPARFGPASYEDARFELPSGETALAITLN